MAEKQSEHTAATALSALEWLIAMGADEIVQDIPVDRFAPVAAAPLPPPQPKAAVLAPPPQPRAPAPVVTGSQALADARAMAEACVTLDDMISALTRFEACPLKRTATNLCFADGNRQAHTLVIGEAPGRDEDIQGKPFVGRSGQLLDRILKEIGLSRHAEDPAQAVYITNTIYWRPPGNRTPTEAETGQCLPFLKRTIEILQPRRILCVGVTPTQRLINRTDGILKLRGKWYDYDAGGRNIPLLATLHPAYLLRQPAQKRLAWRDVLALRRAIDAG